MRDLIEQASPLLFPGGFPQSIMNNSINTILQNGIQPTNGKPYYVGGKKGGSHFNIMCLKMCSLCGGDFRNRFSVFGLYVMPTHG